MRTGFLATVAFLGLGLSPFGVASSVAQVLPNADLAIVSNTPNVRHAKVGQAVTFTIVGRDMGPDATDGLHVVTGQAEQGFTDGPPLCDRFGDCSSTIICDRTQSSVIPSADGRFCEFNDIRSASIYRSGAPPFPVGCARV